MNTENQAVNTMGAKFFTPPLPFICTCKYLDK